MKINRLLLVALAYTYSNLACASDMGGLAYLMGFQAVVILWPVLMPLAFLGDYKAKLKSYFIILTLVYGVSGVVNLPITFFNSLSLWLGESDSAMILIFIQQPIAFILSIVCIKKFGSLVIFSIIGKCE
jgi:hypothetical protein